VKPLTRWHADFHGPFQPVGEVSQKVSNAFGSNLQDACSSHLVQWTNYGTPSWVNREDVSDAAIRQYLANKSKNKRTRSK